MADKKMTIKDIAKMADVSPGTVDRVLHNRGKVSADKKARIDKVLNEINYQPNLIAKTLKNNKVHRVAVLMPSGQTDPYWARAEMGLRKGLDEFGTFGIAADTHFFSADDPRSIYSTFEAVDLQGVDCILLAPLFERESELIFEQALQYEKPIITFNTRASSSLPAAFIGQDLVQSGRVAGQLLHMTQSPSARILLVHIDEVPESAPHIADKEKGIRQYFAEQGYATEQVRTASIHRSASTPLKEALRKSEALTEDVSAVFITTSRSYEIAPYIHEQVPEAVIIGYDLVEENTRLMRDGIITFLIDQNPFQQAYLGLSIFCDHLVFGKPIPDELLLPLNVAFRENVDSLLRGRPGMI